jgi:hypothetical protein
MSRTVSAIRSLLLGLALASVAVPGVALADPKAPATEAPQGKAHKGHHPKEKGHKAERERPEFPMDAKSFTKLIEERIARAKKKLGHALEKRDASPEVKKQAEELFEGRAKELRAAVDKAEADDVVTKEEARAVRDLAKALRPKKDKHPGDKPHHGKGGHKHPKGGAAKDAAEAPAES